MASFATVDAWLALFTLTAMEIVLGIDNLVIISILVAKLPPASREQARRLGLSLALITRLALLFSITWLMGLREPLFAVNGQAFSGRNLILLLGGLFLICKSTLEIHESLSAAGRPPTAPQRPAGFWWVVAQVLVMDVIFSLDSVIAAVGMAQQLIVMVLAIVLAVLIMVVSSQWVGRFIERHPTIKMLALAFLLLIGVFLMMDGLGIHLPKGYIYFAMAFSLAVETLNVRLRQK